MGARFEKLLEPYQLQQVKLRNRIVKPGQVSCFADKDGYVTEQMKDFYEGLAKGGVGMLIVESTAVDFPYGPSGMPRLLIHEDKFVPGLSELAKVIRQQGAAAFLQISHAGPQMPSALFGVQATSSSTLSAEEAAQLASAPPLELSVAEIEGLVDKFARAAERAREAGYDGVEIHAAHHYLINSFLSRAWNKRQDAYGCKDLGTRSRFAADIIREIKKRVGKDYPVGIRINGAEYGTPKGLTSEETQGISQILEQAGVDFLHISVWGFGRFRWMFGPEQLLYPEPASEASGLVKLIKKPGSLVPLAEAIKKKVSIPVIAVGRLDPALGEYILQNGKADLIALGRRLLADPELPNKLAEGRLEDIRPCTACMTCLSAVTTGQPKRCRINPALGKEREYAIKPAQTKKRVLVVGGGPGGMTAAMVAAQRGHEVLLFDSQHNLGGLLPLAAMVKGTEVEDLPGLIHYYKTQLDKLGVTVRLGKKIDVALVDKIKPDVVIIASGGTPTLPEVKGINNPKVLSSAVLHREIKPFLRFLGPDALGEMTRIWMPVGKRVVVMGGLIQGCETAEFLAKRGRKVTIVETSNQLGSGIPSIYTERLLPWLKGKGVVSLTGVKYEEITEKGALVISKDGTRQTIEADTILVAMPFAPNTELFQSLQGKVPAVHLIGDSKEPRLIVDAIDEGWHIACGI